MHQCIIHQITPIGPVLLYIDNEVFSTKYRTFGFHLRLRQSWGRRQWMNKLDITGLYYKQWIISIILHLSNNYVTVWNIKQLPSKLTSECVTSESDLISTNILLRCGDSSYNWWWRRCWRLFYTITWKSHFCPSVYNFDYYYQLPHNPQHDWQWCAVKYHWYMYNLNKCTIAIDLRVMMLINKLLTRCWCCHGCIADSWWYYWHRFRNGWSLSHFCKMYKERYKY